VLEALNKIEGEFSEDDVTILYASGTRWRLPSRTHQLYQEAITDGLTGLYHHKYFEPGCGKNLTGPAGTVTRLDRHGGHRLFQTGE
jgi:hypothetical protein